MNLHKSNEQFVWNYLSGKGFNSYAIAGILGNMYAESGLNPSNLQDTGNRSLGMTDEEYTAAVDNGTYTREQFANDSIGYGICQWTWHTRCKALYDFAKSKNKSIGDLECQLDFFYKELTESYKTVYNDLKKATSVREASNVMLLKYESPADQSIAVQNKRASIGQGFYDKYAIRENKGGDGNMSVGTYSKSVSVELSTNFFSHEFNCHGSGCCSQTKVDPKLVVILQQIRDHFGKPVTITSGYRCYTHNRSIGGATSSYHAKGMAVDITVEGVKPREVAKFCESIGVNGIGLYETSADGYFVHIDTRPNKYFWYGQAQAYRSTFGGATTTTTTSAPTSTPTINSTELLLIRGSKGTQVKAMQEKLIALGYNLGSYGADGDFGQKTDTAVRKFQMSKGLVVDGKAGTKTLEALDKAYEALGEKEEIKVKITASVLNVRSGAGMNYPVVGKVKRNSVQTVLEEKNGWGRISNGWISSSYYQKF